MSTVTTNVLIVVGILVAIFILTLIFNKGKQLKMIFTIDAGGEKRVEILASRKWNEIEVRVDGILACTISKKELLSGYDLQLSDGSVLNIKRPRFFLNMQRLLITRNGQPISHSITSYDNQMAVNNAAHLIYIIALVNLILGIISIFINMEAFSPFQFGWLNIIFGFVFMILGFFTQRKSVAAMILFIVIFGLDSLSFLLLLLQTGNYIIILVFLIRLVVLAPVFLGLGEVFRRKTKIVSTLFNITGAVLMIAALVGMCGVVTWAITNAVTAFKGISSSYPISGKRINSVQATFGVGKNGSCTLKIKDTAEAVNIRDAADSSTGKVVDYLGKGDLAEVLGKDGGATGNTWWFIEVVHGGSTVQGWVNNKWVEFEVSANCSRIKVIATPFP